MKHYIKSSRMIALTKLLIPFIIIILTTLLIKYIVDIWYVPNPLVMTIAQYIGYTFGLLFLLLLFFKRQHIIHSIKGYLFVIKTLVMFALLMLVWAFFIMGKALTIHSSGFVSQYLSGHKKTSTMIIDSINTSSNTKCYPFCQTGIHLQAHDISQIVHLYFSPTQIRSLEKEFNLKPGNTLYLTGLETKLGFNIKKISISSIGIPSNLSKYLYKSNR